MTTLARRRPWRAIAFVVDPTAPQGRRRTVAGRVAACSPEGLDRFVDRHRDQGNAVDVFEVPELPDEEHAATPPT